MSQYTRWYDEYEENLSSVWASFIQNIPASDTGCFNKAFTHPKTLHNLSHSCGVLELMVRSMAVAWEVLEILIVHGRFC